jgi:hypothetical protein
MLHTWLNCTETLSRSWQFYCKQMTVTLLPDIFVVILRCIFIKATNKASLVSISHNILSILKCYFVKTDFLLSNSDLDIFTTDTRVTIPSYPLVICSVNRPKQTQVIMQRLNNSDIDLDDRHLGSNIKLRSLVLVAGSCESCVHWMSHFLVDLVHHIWYKLSKHQILTY